MKKFKIFFYPAYLIIAIVILYFSLDILINMDTYQEKIDFNTLRKLPTYLMYLFFLLSLLMITELVVENIQIIKLRKKARHAEEEALRLKAKLYDRDTELTDHEVSGFLKESPSEYDFEEHLPATKEESEDEGEDEYELN